MGLTANLAEVHVAVLRAPVVHLLDQPGSVDGHEHDRRAAAMAVEFGSQKRGGLFWRFGRAGADHVATGVRRRNHEAVDAAVGQ